MNKIIKLSIWVVMYSQYYLYRLSVSHQLNKQKKNKNESKNVKNKAIQEAQKAQKKRIVAVLKKPMQRAYLWLHRQKLKANRKQ